VKKKISEFIYTIGILLILFSVVISIGVGLYNWGPGDMEFADAAWLGFILYVKLILLGLTCIVLGYFIER
jgi:hypothetical protein